MMRRSALRGTSRPRRLNQIDSKVQIKRQTHNKIITLSALGSAYSAVGYI